MRKYNEIVHASIPALYEITPLGGGKVSVYNKSTRTTTIQSENYPLLKGSTVKNTPLTKGVRNTYASASKSYQHIEKRPTPSADTIEMLERTEYSNGLKSNQYSFFDTFSVAPTLWVSPAKTMNAEGSPNPGQLSLFNDRVDFTIGNIQRINKWPEEYNDFVYNAISRDKIKSSMHPSVRSSLLRKYNLDGSLFIDTVSDAVKTALIADEDNYFSRSDIAMIGSNWNFYTEVVPLSNIPENNYLKVTEIISDKTHSLNPKDYDDINKNRLLNWTVLAEDAKKHIILKTSDSTQTKIFLPNSEVINVYDSTGGSHSLEMQDGNYFAANPVVGDSRLTVFAATDTETLRPKELAQCSRLLGERYTPQLTCTSLESDLLELNVDVTGTRKEYYFLKADKGTISDEVPDNPLFRKTTAEYDYITDTDAMSSYIKHRAFPNFIVYLRSDDILFNYLEKTQKAKLSFNDPSITSYLDPGKIKDIARRFPWYVIIIPTDVTANIPTQARSVLKDFSTRTISLEPAPKVTDSTYNPRFISENVTTTGSINYDTDTEDREYTLAFSLLTTTTSGVKYRTGSEVIPRKLHPTNKVLQKIKEIKDSYSLSGSASISFYDLYTRLEPKDFRSLLRDNDLGVGLLRKLRINKVAETASINKDNFVSLKDIPKVGSEGEITGPLLDTSTMPQVFSKRATAGASIRGSLVTGGATPTPSPSPTPSPAPSPITPTPY